MAAAGCLLPALACAHGANLDYQMTPGITLQAKYDAGGPMTQAQFTVYAPNDPTTPWLTGKSDAQGRFSFVPDANIPGMQSGARLSDEQAAKLLDGFGYYNVARAILHPPKVDITPAEAWEAEGGQHP